MVAQYGEVDSQATGFNLGGTAVSLLLIFELHTSLRTERKLDMRDLLIFEESLKRLNGVFVQFDSLRVICWHSDGSFSWNGQPIDADAIQPEIGWINFDILNAGKMQHYVETLLQFKTLRWVQTGHAGLDHLLYSRLAECDVRLSKSYAQSIAIAEYTLAHALHYFQDIEFRLSAQRAAEWKSKQFRELYGSRWLIVGFGHIGRRVAKRARGFECHITTLRRSGAADSAADEVISGTELSATLAKSDVVVLACPETAETAGLVDAEFIAAMKKGSLLINVARGGLIDDTALINGLDIGRPGFAVLDAFSVEPLPVEHPYWAHPNVVITAHMSNRGSGTSDRGTEQFLANLRLYLNNGMPDDEVNLQSILSST